MSRAIHQTIHHQALNVLQRLNTQFETILADGFVQRLQGIVVIEHFTLSVANTFFTDF